MGRTNVDETYLSAFHAAIEQREHIFHEFELLKQRRTLLEEAARSLEPLVYPDEYQRAQQALAEGQAAKAVVEIRSAAPGPEIWNPTIPAEVPAPDPVAEPAPVPVVTQVYVHGDGEPDEEIQRRISIAIGRSAAD